MRVFLAVVLALACSPGFAQGERAASEGVTLVDRIVAVVNKEVITRYELSERSERALKELGRRGTSPPNRGEIERQVLERMITDKVQLQYAKETALRVDDLDPTRVKRRVRPSNTTSPISWCACPSKRAPSSWRVAVRAPGKR